MYIVDKTRAYSVNPPALLSLAIVLLFAGAACAAIVDPKWVEPDYACRAVFKLPDNPGACVLVTIPVDPSDSRGAVTGAGSRVEARAGVSAVPPVVARLTDGSPLPCRIVHSGPENVAVLVEVGNKPRKGDFHAVYFRPISPADGTIAGAATRGPQPGEFLDPAPIMLDLYPHAGDSAPTTWEKMLYLFRSASRPLRTLKLSNFGPVELTEKPTEKPDAEEKKPRRREHRIGVASTILLAPVDGDYTFALDCRDAGFLLVNGEMAAAWPGKHPGGEWREGKPISLSSGPQLLEIYNSAQGEMRVRPGWRLPPGTGGARREISAIPPSSLLASSEAVGLRVEALGQTVHPGFSHSILPSYSFRDVDAVFTPVRFTQTTRNWIARDMRCRWRFRDRGAGEVEGESVMHRFTRVGIHKAVLLVRDDLGFTGSLEQSIDLRFVQPRQYAISAEMVGIPALCHPSDPLVSRIRVEGEAPPGESVEIRGEVTLQSGRRTAFGQTLRPSKHAALIPVVTAEAGRLREIRWEMTHDGVPLRSGVVIFQPPPFGRLPAELRGDRLYDAEGNQVVLISSPGPGAPVQPRQEWKPALARVLLLDDGLSRSPASDGGGGGQAAQELADELAEELAKPTAPGRGVFRRAGAPTPAASVRVSPIPEWDESSLQYGPLLKFVHVPEAVRSNADLVVLNVGVEDILKRRDVEAFERQTAALTDLVSASMRIPVVWVTPPPFLPDRLQVRPFAAAIKRTADARGIPVADLYSAFAGDPDPASLFVDPGRLAFSERGRRLAAEIIARAIRVQREDLD